MRYLRLTHHGWTTLLEGETALTSSLTHSLTHTLLTHSHGLTILTFLIPVSGMSVYDPSGGVATPTAGVATPTVGVSAYCSTSLVRPLVPLYPPTVGEGPGEEIHTRHCHITLILDYIINAKFSTVILTCCRSTPLSAASVLAYGLANSRLPAPPTDWVTAGDGEADGVGGAGGAAVGVSCSER